VRRIGRVDPVDDRLEVALDDGQRRAQLVADLGEEVAALALVGLEPGGPRCRRPRPDRPDPEPAGRAIWPSSVAKMNRALTGPAPESTLKSVVEPFQTMPVG
jgi:hypothetical protein